MSCSNLEGKVFRIMLLKLLTMIKNNQDIPDVWNNILISTIYKKERQTKNTKQKGTQKILKNRRGIFLTPSISKLFEKLIKNRISQSVEEYTTLFQAGKRSNRSKADTFFLFSSIQCSSYFM